MAPNVFHIGVEEKVSVTVFDAGKPVTVKVYLSKSKSIYKHLYRANSM